MNSCSQAPADEVMYVVERSNYNMVIKGQGELEAENANILTAPMPILPARAPPEVAEWVIEPCYDDPFPDYDTEPVMMYANG